MNKSTVIGIASVNILFWITIYLVGLELGFTWENPPFNTDNETYAPAFLWGTLINILIFYGNGFGLIPLKNSKKWNGVYWILALVMILVLTIIEGFGDFLLAKNMGLLEIVYEEIFEEVVPDWIIIFGFTLQDFFVNIVFFILSFSNVLYIENVKEKKVKQAFQQEQLKSELKYLKAQINPHFLFNGINSVYHLIDQKPALAKDTLLKFSNLLRYQLYECNDDLIPLAKELDHIRDYVEMEKIRKGEDVLIDLTIPDDLFQTKIPPLLFTPFIENAFKYVSNHDGGTKNKVNINIRLQETQGKLRFEVENTIDENRLSGNGGIGISNVQKRLALLFPNNHDLDIIENEDRFVVRMSLNLIK